MKVTINIKGGGTIWFNHGEYQNMKDFMKKRENDFWKNLMYGDMEVRDKRRAKQRILHFAYITVGKTRKLCMVDKNTDIPYKLDGYKPTLIEYKHYTFDKWCTSMDI